MPALIERKPISKRLRFSVFKRDFFCCQYCGRKPPEVKLEVDHIVPLSKGGKDLIDNLATSCFDCNRGKADIELSVIPETTEQKILIAREKEEQYREYKKLLKSIENREQEETKKLRSVWNEYFADDPNTEGFERSSLRLFVRKLGINTVVEAMYLACEKKPYVAKTARLYFCGICWKKIKGEGRNG